MQALFTANRGFPAPHFTTVRLAFIFTLISSP